jgi:hypothetical protein
MGSFKPRSRREEIVIQKSNGEVLIYDLRANKALCLNKTSALVWEACDGTNDQSDLKNAVSRQLNTSVSDEVVWLALEQLKREDLLESGFDLPNRFDGMSRREVIKKIGIGSMVALPIVASLIAPPAIYALSVCPATNPGGCPTSGGSRAPGCACSGNGNCTSGTCIPAQPGAIQCCA